MIANQSDTERIVVGEESGAVRGYAHFGRSRDPDALPNVGELYSLYVAPLHWRRGLGKILLAASLQEPTHMTFDTATFGCSRSMDKLAHFMGGADGGRMGLKRPRTPK